MPEAANHQQPETMGVIYRMPTSELHPHPDNPFGVRDDPEMQELVDSVQKFGVLVPAIARPRPDGGFELISGHRRKHASELAGLDFMPVIVLTLTMMKPLFSWSIATSSEKMCCPLKERKHIKCGWKLSSEQQADRQKAKKKIRRKFRLISAATMNWVKRPVSAVIPSETTSLLPTLYRS